MSENHGRKTIGRIGKSGSKPPITTDLRHLSLKASKVVETQVVETSVTTTDNSPSQDYTHPDDQTTLLNSSNKANVFEFHNHGVKTRPLGYGFPTRQIKLFASSKLEG